MTALATNSDALPAHVDRALLDAAGCVAVDVPCHACHYNLRTLPAAGRCPECGAPVVDSVRRPDLAYASPQWVMNLADGSGLLATSCFLVALAAGLAVLGIVLDNDLPVAFVCPILLFLVLPLSVAGLVLVTRRERTPAPGACDSRLRGASRVTALAVIGLGVTGAAKALAEVSVSFGLPIFGGLLLCSSVVLALSVLPALLWAYASVLMRRAGRPDLARRAGLLAPVHVVASLAILVAPLFDPELLGPVALGGVCILAIVETVHLAPVSVALDRIARPREVPEAAGGHS